MISVMKKHLSLILCIWLAVDLFPMQLKGQENPFQPENLAKKFFEVKKTSSELIRQFTWNTRTDVTRKDKVVDILIEENRYEPDGKLVHKVVNDQEAKLPSSFLVHRIAFMNDLRLFLQEYALEDLNKAINFFSKAKIIFVESQGDIIVSSENIITKGDKMTWWMDKSNYSTTKASISTIFQGSQVEFTATYKFSSPGIHYMTFAEIIVPSKTIMVQIHSYDYVKIN
jgi:hypothetical protein